MAREKNTLYIFRHTKQVNDVQDYLDNLETKYTIIHMYDNKKYFEKNIFDILEHSMYGFTEILNNREASKHIMQEMTVKELLVQLWQDPKLARSYFYLSSNGERFNGVDVKGRPKHAKK